MPLGVQHTSEACPHGDETSGCGLMSVHIFHHSLLPTMSPLPQLLNPSLQSRERQRRLKETKIPPASLRTEGESLLVANGYWIHPQEWTIEVWAAGKLRVDVLVGWDYSSCFLPAEMGACQISSVIQSACFLCRRALRYQAFCVRHQADKCTQNDGVISNICSLCLYPQCLYRQIHGSEHSLTLLVEGCG